MLLSALLKHHVLPSVRAVAEGGLQGRGDADNWTFLTDRDFRRAMARMREIIEEAETLSKEGAA